MRGPATLSFTERRTAVSRFAAASRIPLREGLNVKTNLMQRMAAGVAMSAVLAIGHPAAAGERGTAEPRLKLDGVPLARVLQADPRGVHGSAAFLARAVGVDQTASDRKARDRARRIRRGAAVGAGFGALMGFFAGHSWCENETGGDCVIDPLSLGFAGLGALVGAGIFAGLEAINPE